jgi:hypothetical protein
MSDSLDPRRDDEDLQQAEAADRAALEDYAERRGTCDATGEPLNPAESVAMTVGVAPGISTFAMVTAAHWDAGQGEFSTSDPRVDPDVLDGRQLFRRDPQSTGRPSGRSAAIRRVTGLDPRGPGTVQQPCPVVPPAGGPSPRPS